LRLSAAVARAATLMKRSVEKLPAQKIFCWQSCVANGRDIAETPMKCGFLWHSARNFLLVAHDAATHCASHDRAPIERKHNTIYPAKKIMHTPPLRAH